MLSVSIGGVVVVMVVTLGTFAAAKSLLPDVNNVRSPTLLYLSVNLLVSALAAASGGFTTAFISRARAPWAHCAVLAAILFCLSLITAIQGANGGQPVWYPWSLAVIAPFGVMMGGWFVIRFGPKTRPSSASDQ